MQPYYDDGNGIQIYLGDCREVLPTIATKSVDLVLTDPKFNAGIDYGDRVNDRIPWPEYVSWLVGIIDEMERVSTGPVLVFTSVKGMTNISAARPPRHVAAWVKPHLYGHRQGGSAFIPRWEPCLAYGVLWGEGGRVPSYSLPDVWNHPAAIRNGHPCPKPVSLFAEILRQIPGDTVLDPFMGSGTTLRAAKDLGRKAIGIEIEERYAEIAANRLAQSVLALGA